MKIKHSKSYYVYQVFNTIILTLVTLSCIFPILHVFAMSLSDSTAAMAGRVTFFPVDFSLAAYEYLIKKKISSILWPSPEEELLSVRLST